MRTFIYAVIPLLVLLTAITLACMISYFIILGIGDHYPLRKIVSKLTQLCLVLSIFPAMKILKINKKQLGFSATKIFLHQLLKGFGLGLITLIPVFMVLYLLNILVFDTAQLWMLESLAKTILVSLLLAFLISLIEEPLFRGILLIGLHKKLPAILAILISSGYYAALHFLNSKTDIPYQDINLFSGFSLVIDAFASLLNPELMSPFIALFMVGVFLGVLRTLEKTSLGLCIGCHTCWVWQIKMSKSLFNTDFNSEYAFLVSRYDGVIGSLVSVWLFLAIVVLWRFISKNNRLIE